MNGTNPIENNEVPHSIIMPIRKCDRCDNELGHPIFNTVFIADGKEVCGTCIDILIEENKKKIR